MISATRQRRSRPVREYPSALPSATARPSRGSGRSAKRSSTLIFCRLTLVARKRRRTEKWRPLMDDRTFVDSHDVEIFTRWWTIEGPRAVVLVSHGASEHSGRYDRFARALNEA